MESILEVESLVSQTRRPVHWGRCFTYALTKDYICSAMAKLKSSELDLSTLEEREEKESRTGHYDDDVDPLCCCEYYNEKGARKAFIIFTLRVDRIKLNDECFSMRSFPLVGAFVRLFPTGLFGRRRHQRQGG